MEKRTYQQVADDLDEVATRAFAEHELIQACLSPADRDSLLSRRIADAWHNEVRVAFRAAEDAVFARSGWTENEFMAETGRRIDAKRARPAQDAPGCSA